MSIIQPDHDEDFDEDIIDIFVEEAQEVIEEVNEHFPRWLEDPGDLTSLHEICRAFHTLKGSGRMVRAADVSELAWAIESLLNRVVDGTLPLTDTVFDLIDNVRDTVPVLVEAFRNRQSACVAGVDVDILVNQANALERGLLAPSVSTASEDVPVLSVEKDQLSSAIPGHDTLVIEGINSKISLLVENTDALSEEFDKLRETIDNVQADVSATASESELRALFDKLSGTQKELQDLKFFVKANGEQKAGDLQQLEQRVESRLSSNSENRQKLSEQLQQDLQSVREEMGRINDRVALWSFGAAISCSIVTAVVMYLIL